MKDPADRPPAGSDGILGRWARRKSAVRRGDDLADPADEEVAEIAEASPRSPLPLVTDTPVEQPLRSEEAVPSEVAPGQKPPLPALDSLTGDSDFSAFMSPEVDATLRRAALRKLFHTPGMNITDGLDDYDDDYTSFEPLGDTITADMRHQMEVKEERAERARLEAEQANEPAALEDDAALREDEPERLAAEDTEEIEPPETSTTDVEAKQAGAADDESQQAGADGDKATAEPAARIAGDDEAADDEPQSDDEQTANRNAAQARPGDEPRG